MYSMCGSRPALDRGGLQQVYFGTSKRSGQTVQSVDDMFRSCSHGYARFLSEDNIIVELDVPCTGTTASGQQLGDPKKKCDFSLMVAAQEWAEAHVRDAKLVDQATLQAVRRRINVYPAVCPITALGTTGCGPGWCNVWVAGGQAVTDPGSYVHEIGHTLGLNHASSPDGPTGDASSPMGWCCGGAKCHNAPHLLQLGWSKPLLDVAVSDMTKGRKVAFTLPELSLSAKNMVRIRPTWTSKSQSKSKSSNATVYISYRAPMGYDGGIVPEWTNAVHVHSYVEGDAASLPMAEARLTKGGATWTDRALGISVTVKVMNGTTATATLTRVT